MSRSEVALDSGAELIRIGPDSVNELARREREATRFAWTEPQISQSLSDGHLCFTLGVRDQVFGYCVLLPLGQVVDILNLVIFPEFQQQGYGRILLEKIKTIALQQGAESLWLEVREGNQHARDLYQNAGFFQTGRREHYYPRDQHDESGEAEDAILMQFDLTKSC